MVRPRVFMDVSVSGNALGRIIFELYNDTAPLTSENFRALCTGEKGRNEIDTPLYYKNSIMHRVIADFMVQGGDFTKKNGMGGESIYGRVFPDEDLTRPLDAEGLLCMANRGPDTQSSQFFITLRPCPHLNGKHCVFGRVVRGFDDVVEKIAQVAVDDRSRPLSPVVISNCGELELRKQPPPAKRTGAESEKEEEEPRSRPKSKRAISELENSDKDEPHRTRLKSRSRSPDNLDSSKKRHRKKSKHKHKRDKGENVKEVKGVELNFRGETEEEYDARLEREEKERLEAARKIELAQIKHKYEIKSQTKDGVTFKGRGRMKYIDPDVQFR